MMPSVDAAKSWFQIRTQEQRVLILLSILIICFGLWYVLWESGYQSRSIALAQQIGPLREQIATLDKQDQQMKKILADPQVLQKHKQLAVQLKNIDTQIQATSTQFVSTTQMSAAMKDLLTDNSGLKLLRLENIDNPLIKSTEKSSQKLYRHNFVMEFEGNYHETLQYLKRLEKLPWRFYWDGITYDVTTYPDAKIKIQLHTVSPQQGLINDA